MLRRSCRATDSHRHSRITLVACTGCRTGDKQRFSIGKIQPSAPFRLRVRMVLDCSAESGLESTPRKSSSGQFPPLGSQSCALGLLGQLTLPRWLSGIKYLYAVTKMCSIGGETG
jgi:hypothetical protein